MESETTTSTSNGVLQQINVISEDPAAALIAQAHKINGSSPGQTYLKNPGVPASSIVIFHPGSKYLRVGRASDTTPCTLLHAIARRRRKATDNVKNGKNYVTINRTDPLFPVPNDLDLKNLSPGPEVELARLQLCHTLQTSFKSDGSCRFATPSQTIAEFNKSCKGFQMETSEEAKDWKSFQGHETVIGNDVMDLKPDGEFSVHFPWRRGQLNVHSGVGGSITSVINDLTDIWKWCITDLLQINLKDLQNFRAVVVIPVMMERSHMNEIFNAVVNNLGFGYCFLIQDHICATFGAGTPCATVVDVGDQKVSVSCVDDGVSFPQSRIELKYGCGDLNIAFWNLMTRGSVPVSVDMSCLWDMEFLSKLKERLCHLDLNRCGPEEQKIIWDKPGASPLKYNVYFGDELLIVPLGYFNPDLLRCSISSNSSVIVHRSNQLSSDDPFDASYVSETSRRVLKEAEGDGDDDYLEESKEEMTTASCKIDTDKLLGVDQAILKSIEFCGGTDDMKRRLYSCILVVGGGFKFNGIGDLLQNKVSLNVPRLYKSDACDVITSPKEGDPAETVWKGAAILSCLETAFELWIAKLEWNTFGSRILRERSLCAI